MGSPNTGGKDDSAASDGGGSSSDGLPDVNTSIFSEGEKVLAYHGPRIYEAKVQKTGLREKEWRYFVHYLGWSKNWDEWVGTDRLLKYTDENIRKQQTLEKKQGADKNLKSGRLNQAKPKSSNEALADKEDTKNNVIKGKRRRAESGVEKESVSTEKLAKFPIPSTLRKQLVDDWEYVTRQDKLVKLPRSPSVDEILKKYLEYRSKKDGMMTDSIAEILNGLRCYFDKALPLMLLYKKERQQYLQAVTDNTSPSTIYGAEHLLRLFVKLPELLAYVNIEEEALTRLQQKLLDFLKYEYRLNHYLIAPSIQVTLGSLLLILLLSLTCQISRRAYLVLAEESKHLLPLCLRCLGRRRNGQGERRLRSLQHLRSLSLSSSSVTIGIVRTRHVQLYSTNVNSLNVASGELLFAETRHVQCRS